MEYRFSFEECCSRHVFVQRETIGGWFGCSFHSKLSTENKKKVWTCHGLGWVLRGHGWYRDWNGALHDVGPGDAFQHVPGRPHTIHRNTDEPWSQASMRLAPRLYDVASTIGCVDPQTPVLRPGLDMGLVRAWDGLHRRMTTCRDGEMPTHCLEALRILRALRERSEGQSVQDPVAELMEDACRQLTMRLDKQLDLEGLARDLGMSYSTFRRTFRERIGMAPGAYRLERRMEYAQSLLLHDGWLVQEIAEHLGYSDPFAFSRQFKKAVGQSPAVWAKAQGLVSAPTP